MTHQHIVFSSKNAAHIPFKFVGDKIHLPVRINDHEPSGFVFDTGAPMWILDVEHARSLGLRLDESQVVQCMGASSEMTTPAYRVPGLSMGLPGVQLRQQTALTLAMASINGKFGPLPNKTLAEFNRAFSRAVGDKFAIKPKRNDARYGLFEGVYNL